MIEEQHQAVVDSGALQNGAKVGFVSLGCPKAEGQSKLQPLLYKVYCQNP